MGLGERIAERIGLVTRSRLSEVRRRAYQDGFREAVETGPEDEPAAGGLERYGYKSLGSGAGTREAKAGDLSWQDQVNLAYNLWRRDMPAKRALGLKRDYIVGGGVSLHSEDEELQAILDAFWEGNRMNQRADEFAHQLFLFGVQMLTVFVRDSDGRVRQGYIDPGMIEKVETHPDNAMERYAVVLAETQPQGWREGRGRRVYRIVRKAEHIVQGDDGDEIVRHAPDELEDQLITAKQAEGADLLEDWERKMLASYGLEHYTGTCFLFRANAVSNQPLGTSDTLPAADWADVTDETLFGLADREQFAGYFSWDVELEGAEGDQVTERSAEIRRRGPPKRGSVNVHNDAEHWEMNSPDLKQQGSIDAYRALFNHMWGGYGYPEAWYGRGEQTSRATIQGQNDPTWKTLEHDQGVVKDMLTDMVQFAVDQARIAGSYTNDDASFSLEMPEMVPQYASERASAFLQLTQALSILMGQLKSLGVPRGTALEVVSQALSEMNVEFDPSEAEEPEESPEDGGEEDGADLLAPFLEAAGAAWDSYP